MFFVYGTFCRFSTAQTLTLFTGIYCVAFGLAIYALYCRKSSVHRIYKGCTIGLFVLATINAAAFTCYQLQYSLIAYPAGTSKVYNSFVQYLIGDYRKTVTTWVCNSSFIATKYQHCMLVL